MMAVMHFLWLIFDLPSGSVWSNLVASVLWGTAAYMIMRVMKTKLVDSLDGTIDKKLSFHHEQIKNHMENKMSEYFGREHVETEKEP